MNRIELPLIDLRNGSALRRFWLGFSFPFRGFAFVIRTPALWPWVVLPVVLMSGLIVGAGCLALWGAPKILGLLWAAPASGVLLFLWQSMVASLWAGLFVVSTIALYLCFGVLATPFYDQLSERTEALLIGPREDVSWRQWWGDIAQSVAHSLCAFGLWVCFFGVALMLSVLPVVGQLLDFFIGGSLTAFLLAREMMDGPMSRRRFTFRTKIGVVRQNFAVSLGFGVATSLFLAVPILNILSLPCAVVGGTRLFVQLEKQSLLPSSPSPLPALEPLGLLSKLPEDPSEEQHKDEVDSAIDADEQTG